MYGFKMAIRVCASGYLVQKYILKDNGDKNYTCIRSQNMWPLAVCPHVLSRIMQWSGKVGNGIHTSLRLFTIV